MRAVVFHGEHDVRVDDVPDPVLLAASDVIVRVRTAAICGSDLHIYNGRVPGVMAGSTIGHEYVGEIVDAGTAVSGVAVGDRVVGSFQIVDGSCAACEAGRFNHCDDMGTLGYGIFVGDHGGAQAELIRIPHADINVRTLPDSVSDDAAVFVGDVLTTGYYAASIGEIEPGASVVVVGSGPVGLCAAMSARALGAGRVIVTDLVASRLEMAEKYGAETIDGSQRSVSVALDDLLPGGADVVIETVGLPPALITAIDCCRAGGTISIIGVHTDFEMALPLNNVFVRNITLRFGGSCNVQGVWDKTLNAVTSGALDPTPIVSHHLPLAQAAEGYRMFEAKEALKVLLDVP
jgi:threonine dehydrogenase-like Zn-dependent dehydrogenase